MTEHPDRFSVIIADDEPMARERLRRLLGSDDGIEIVADCASGAETGAAVEVFAPDLLLLDMQMPEMDGFAVVAAIPQERLPIVIFVTAFDEHALRAFAVHALDYLLKPIDPERLHEAVTRARQLRDRAAAAEQHQRIRAMLGVATESLARSPRTADAVRSDVLEAQAGPHRFLVKTDWRMYFVPTADVDWIEAEGN